MFENSDRQLITYLSQDIYDRLRVFANLREISESEAIAQILADRLNVPYLSPSYISDNHEDTIEDEPDEILWSFIKQEKDAYDPDFDEPDEILMEFMED
jgi:hypothetical protein